MEEAWFRLQPEKDIISTRRYGRLHRYTFPPDNVRYFEKRFRDDNPHLAKIQKITKRFKQSLYRVRYSVFLRGAAPAAPCGPPTRQLGTPSAAHKNPRLGRFTKPSAFLAWIFLRSDWELWTGILSCLLWLAWSEKKSLEGCKRGGVRDVRLLSVAIPSSCTHRQWFQLVLSFSMKSFFPIYRACIMT